MFSALLCVLMQQFAFLFRQFRRYFDSDVRPQVATTTRPTAVSEPRDSAPLQNKLATMLSARRDD